MCNFVVVRVRSELFMSRELNGLVLLHAFQRYFFFCCTLSRRLKPTKTIEFFLELYLLYAKLEEEHGLPRHAMSIYNRATTAVERSQMYSVSFFSLFLAQLVKSCANFFAYFIWHQCLLGCSLVRFTELNSLFLYLNFIADV